MATILDDSSGSPGFVLVGSWTNAAYGYNGQSKYAAAGSGTKSATWTFTDLTPGWYRVGACWQAATNRATNAPYAVYDDTTLLGSVTLNQEVAPSEWTDISSGQKFDYLRGPGWGYYWPVASGTLKVVLTDNANEYVFADAVMIELYSYWRKSFVMGMGF